MANTKVIRIPVEFQGFLNTLSAEFSRQTGFPNSNVATMRRMAARLDGRLIINGADFDFAIIGRAKRRKG